MREGRRSTENISLYRLCSLHFLSCFHGCLPFSPSPSHLSPHSCIHACGQLVAGNIHSRQLGCHGSDQLCAATQKHAVRHEQATPKEHWGLSAGLHTPPSVIALHKEDRILMILVSLTHSLSLFLPRTVAWTIGLVSWSGLSVAVE